MNFGIIRKIIGSILAVEAVFMIPALLISVFCGEPEAARAFAVTIVITAAVGVFCARFRTSKAALRPREGMAAVALSWIAVSVFGCIPFWMSGAIPSLCDSFFETVSGFTTTGATILSEIEGLPKGILYWRSFTHWLGGMGVLVFVLALRSPEGDGFSGDAMHLLRAESTGPVVGKLVPRIQKTAKILYEIYIALTVLEFILLMAGGMPLFDSVTTAFSTAGTGGFAIKNDSMASYSAYCQIVVAVFMLLFGVSFTVYYLILLGDFKKALKNQELITYIGIIAVTTLLITINIHGIYGNTGTALRNAFFTVTSTISTTGYCTVNYDLWPQFSRALIVAITIIGGMAGSTGGGMKVSRLLILLKSAKRNIYKALRPGEVRLIHMDGELVEDDTVSTVANYFIVLILMICVTTVVISLDGFSFEANLTTAITCISNVGPGLGEAGPVCNYSGFSVLSKLLLSADMLLGRLEIYPMLILFVPRAWRK